MFFNAEKQRGGEAEGTGLGASRDHGSRCRGGPPLAACGQGIASVHARHGHRHSPALAMRCIAAAASGHGSGLRPTLNPTERGLMGALRPSIKQTWGFSVKFRVPRSGLPCPTRSGNPKGWRRGPLPYASLLAGMEGASASIAEWRFQTSPVSVVGAVAPSPIPLNPISPVCDACADTIYTIYTIYTFYTANNSASLRLCFSALKMTRGRSRVGVAVLNM